MADEKPQKPSRPPGPPKEALRPVERRVTRTLGDKLKRIRERNEESVRDDRVAVYVMILAFVLICVAVAATFFDFTKIIGLQPSDPLKEIRIEEFVKGKVKRLEDGRLEFFYDFEPLPFPEDMAEEDKQYFDRYPELDDWAYQRGIDGYTGRLIDGGTTFMTFEGPVSVECDFEVLRGHSVQVDAHFLIDGSSFRLSVVPGGRAVISHYKQGVHRPLSDGVEVDVARRRVHSLKFEVTDTKVRSWIDGALLEELANPYHVHDMGKVRLKAWESIVAFDNVRIVGRPHADWIEAKLEIQKTLSGGQAPAPPEADSPKTPKVTEPPE